ncbi:DNA-binding protein [Dethiosulfovibrio salsuginis]|uniref:Phage DNA packaging protein, Nu1 subunit of terminase n=1 Tax=Dethiosulfovibrio salsuginis TaxID=561720 RepID=A0A1X7L0X5_9BACT|nr:DNA-binding protein [Dethiosulfovibrio salsuginis]SMG47345.1 hypothetical protein SAMN06275492_1425 [Dethiosulfovibrio salsuginis]
MSYQAKRDLLDQLISAKDVARLLGVTESWVHKLVKKGYISKTDTGRFSLGASVGGYIQYIKTGESSNLSPQDMMKEKFRLTKAQADKAEMEVQELEKELVRVDEVRRACSDMVSTFRTKALGLPSKVAPKVLGMASVAEVQACLKREVNEVLQELSEYEP